MVVVVFPPFLRQSIPSNPIASHRTHNTQRKKEDQRKARKMIKEIFTHTYIQRASYPTDILGKEGGRKGKKERRKKREKKRVHAHMHWGIQKTHNADTHTHTHSLSFSSNVPCFCVLCMALCLVVCTNSSRKQKSSKMPHPCFLPRKIVFVVVCEKRKHVFWANEANHVQTKKHCKHSPTRSKQ